MGNLCRKISVPQGEHNGATASLEWYHLLLDHHSLFPHYYTKGKLAANEEIPSSQKMLESKGLSSCLIALECRQETLFLAFDHFKLVSCLHGEKARSVAKEESREEMNV